MIRKAPKPTVVGSASNFPDPADPAAQALFAKVGSIITHSSTCETQLAVIFSVLCGNNLTAGVALASLISFEGKLTQLKAALTLIKAGAVSPSPDPKFAADLDHTLDKLKGAFRLRNHIAHGEARSVEYRFSDNTVLKRLVIRPGLLGTKGNDQNLNPTWEYDLADLEEIDSTVRAWSAALGFVSLHFSFGKTLEEYHWGNRPELPNMPQLSALPHR